MPEYLSGDDLLRIFIAADRALDDRKRERFRVALQRTGALVRHRGFARLAEGASGSMRCNRQDIEDLVAEGYLRLDRSTGRDGPWEFDVKPEGFARIDALDRPASADDGGAAPPGLDWTTDIFPVLQAVYDVSGSADPYLGPDQDAINRALGREPGDESTIRALIALAQGGYVEATIEVMTIGPANVRILDRGLQQVAGWPRGDASDQLGALLAAIDERIAAAATEDERSRLQRLRNAVTGIGRDVLVSVLSDAARRASGEIL